MKYLALILILFSTPQAMAGDWYVTYGMGRAELPLKVDVSEDMGRLGFFTEVDDDSQAASGVLGYRFNNHFALELGYRDLGDYNVCLFNSYIGQNNLLCASAVARSISLGAVASAGPVFVGVEAHYAWAKGSQIHDLWEMSAVVPAAVAGFRIPISKHSRIRAEARYPKIPGWFIGMEHDLK